MLMTSSFVCPTLNLGRKKSTGTEPMQVSNGTGPGIRSGKRPLSACQIRRKCSMESSKLGKRLRSEIRHGLA